MESTTHHSPLTRMTLIVGGLLIAVVSIGAAVGTTVASVRRSPFVWVDVLAVSLLCALPFAVTFSERAAARIPRLFTISTSVLLLAAVPWFLKADASEPLLAWGRQSEWGLAAVRFALSVAACLGGTLFVAALTARNRERNSGSRTGVAVSCLLLLAIAATVPELYVDARCRRDRERMFQFAASERVADALQIARSLSVLRPGALVELGDGQQVSMATYAGMWQQHADRLEQRLGGLPRSESPTVRLERGRLQAKLGRRTEAIRELSPVSEARAAPQKIEACLLLGTICEHNEDWNASLQWYQRALQTASQTRSRAKTRMVATALKGIALASRKLGRYSDAESAYETLIALAPTAENHFLLARFYQDAQQGQKAQRHARKAIELAPHRFQQPGESLIDDVVTNDFGCLGAFLRELQGR